MKDNVDILLFRLNFKLYLVFLDCDRLSLHLTKISSLINEMLTESNHTL